MNFESEEIAKVLKESNRIWNSIAVSRIVEKPEFQICLTPEIPELKFLNTAYGIRSESVVEEIEAIFKSANLDAAFYLDPGAPKSLPEILSRRGYIRDDTETEVWKYFDLTKLGPHLENILKESVQKDIRLIQVPRDAPRDAKDPLFQEFMSVVSQAHGLTQRTSDHIALKLSQTKQDETELLLCAGQYKGKIVSTSCLGISSRHAKDTGFLSLGATLPDYRRLGIFSWLRFNNLIFAKERNCHRVYTNIAASNTASLNVSDRSQFQPAFVNELWVKNGSSHE